MRIVAGIMGIVGAVGTVRVGIMVCSVCNFGLTLSEAPDRSRLAEVFQIGRILVAIAGIALGLNLGLMKNNLSRAACVLLGGVGCIALICLGLVFATVIKGAA